MNTSLDPRRYPGAHSFGDSDLDRKLFFGRRRDAKNLVDTILSESLVVLYARSGVGKTSLLKAGVKQALRDENYVPLLVRLNDVKAGPLAALFDGIEEAARRQGIEHQTGLKASLWHYFKTVQFWRGDTLLTPILILDQCEELFTLHQPAVRQEFIEQLANLGQSRPAISVPEPEPPALRLSDTPPALKVVVSIREDYLPMLEELAPLIPTILRTRFRLNPLNREDALAAMEGPAQVEDPQLRTPRFTFAPGAAEDIVKALSTGSEQLAGTPAIESFQLQLVCQYVEDLVRKRSASAETGPPDAGPQPITVSFADLGGEAGLHEVISQFYSRQLDEVGSTFNRGRLEALCERGLVNRDGKRLSVEVGEITRKFKVERTALAMLADARVLRMEPRLGSMYYELSHDSLLKPVMVSRGHRRRKRIQRTWIAGGVAAALALTTFWWWQHFDEARHQVIQNASRALTLLDTDSEQALISAIAAFGEDFDRGMEPEASRALAHILLQKPTLTMAKLGDGKAAAAGLSPSGRLVASVIDSGRLEIRDRGGRMIQSIALAPGSGTPHVVFNSDGDEVAVSRGEQVQVWDIAGREITRGPVKTSAAVTGVAFHPAGGLLAVTTAGKGICTLDLATQSGIDCAVSESIDGELNRILFVGGTLVALSDSGNLFQWSLQDKRLKEIPKPLNVETTASAWDASPDGKSFAVTLGGTVTLWSEGTFKPLLFAEPGGPTMLSFSPDSSRLAVGGKNGKVLVYSVPGGEPDPDLRYDTGIGAVGAIAWHPDGPAAGGNGVFVPRPRNAPTLPGQSPPAESNQGHGDASALNSGQSAVVSRSNALDSYKSNIRSMASLSDGSLITAAADGLRLWDKSKTLSDSVSSRFGSPSLKFRQVVVDPKGRFVIWVDDDAHLGLLSLSGSKFSKTESAMEAVANDEIRSIRISPEGDRLVTVDIRGNVQTWDVAGNRLLRRKEIKNEGRAIFAAFRSSTNGELLVGNSDGSLRQVQENGNSIPLSKFTDPIRAIAAGPAGSIAVGTAGGWVHVVPMDAGTPSPGNASKRLAHAASVAQLRCSKSGETLVSAGADGTVKVLSIGNALRDIKELGATIARPQDVAVSDPGDEVLVLADDQKVFRARFDTPVRSPDLDADVVAVAPHGEYIVALQAADHKLTLLDPLARRSLFWFRKIDECEPTAFAIASDARRIAVGCENGRLMLIDPIGTPTPPPTTLFDNDERVTAVSAAGSRFIAGSSKGRLAIWSANGDKLREPWYANSQNEAKSVSALAVSPDGQNLVAGSSSGIALWQIGATADVPKLVWNKPPPQGFSVTSVVFSPDGKTILCGFDDRTVHQYTSADGKERLNRRIELRRDGNLKAPGVRVTTNRSGEILLTSTDDGEVQLWTSGGEPLTEPIRVLGEGERVDAAFAPDGLTIVTSRVGYAGPRLPGEPRGWLESACERLRYSSAMAGGGAEASGARASCAEYAWSREGNGTGQDKVANADDPTLIHAGGFWRRLVGMARRGEPGALHRAASQGRIAAVKSILDAGADVNVLDGEGRTALGATLRAGFADAARLLLGREASIFAADAYGSTPLHAAAAGELPNSVRRLMELGAAPDVPDRDGVTALMIAAWHGDVGTATLLLGHKAAINAQDQFGRTALMDAAYAERLAMVDLLLKRNADVNLVDKSGYFGRTALLLARLTGNSDIQNRINSARPQLQDDLPAILIRLDLAGILPPGLVWAAPKMLACQNKSPDSAEARTMAQELHDASEKGDADAEFLLGLSYAVGCGNAPNLATAQDRFKEAAARGSAVGEAAYGLTLWLGYDGIQDLNGALRLIESSAEKGNAFGQWLYGAMLSRGAGVVTPEKEKAQEYYERAAGNFAPAANSAGYRMNDPPTSGSSASPEKYRNYLESASARGDVSGASNFAVWQSRRREFDSAVRGWTSLSSTSDRMLLWPGVRIVPHAFPAFNLGLAYQFGLGVAPSDTEAARWFERADKLGSSAAAEQLAYLYKLGLGIKQDLPQAVTLFRRAAARGTYYSRQQLEILNRAP